jgi:hypothetical protein
MAGRRILLAFLAAAQAGVAADWTFYRSGPFEVFTERDKKQARDVLNHLEQLRWVFGQFTGKQEPRTLWPIRIFVTRAATAAALVERSDSWVGMLNDKDDVPRSWNAQLATILMEDNLGRMPLEFERGLVALLSTGEVSGVHVILGQAPARPDLDWARLSLLVTSEDYRGRLRPLLANLEKGVDAGVAFRNSLGKTAAEIDAEATAFLNGRVIPTADIAGKPLNASRDFTARETDETAVQRYIGARSAADSAMGLLEAGRLDEASRLKPEWSEPFRRMAAAEADAGKKAGLLKKACELQPRNGALWQEFAELMMAYQRFADADKAWAAAERASPAPADREKIRARRNELTEARLDAEAEARRQAQLEKEREIQRLKNEAVASIRKAEARAVAELNKDKAPMDPATKVEQWWDGPQPDQTASGKLVRVDCISGKLSLVVDTGGKQLTLKVTDPGKIVIEGSREATLACGIQRPARQVEIGYLSKTSEAAVIKFK